MIPSKRRSPKTSGATGQDVRKAVRLVEAKAEAKAEAQPEPEPSPTPPTDAPPQAKIPFVRALGHEFRSPLNTIVGFSDMLLQGLSGDLNEEQSDFLTRVRNAAQRLGALHGDAIDVLKIQGGLVDPQISRFSLRDLVDSAAEPSKETRDAKGLGFDNLVSEQCWVETDRPQLWRCVAVYLDNAARYSKSGAIAVTATRTDLGLRLVVRDCGIGIDERGLERVFEPFPRLRRPNEGEPASTDLNLYLVRNIAEHVLCGKVAVTSAPEDGSEFSIEFANPLHPSPNATRG